MNTTFLAAELDKFIDDPVPLSYYVFCRKIKERREEPRWHKRKRHEMRSVVFRGLAKVSKYCHCGEDLLIDAQDTHRRLDARVWL